MSDEVKAMETTSAWAVIGPNGTVHVLKLWSDADDIKTEAAVLLNRHWTQLEANGFRIAQVYVTEAENGVL